MAGKLEAKNICCLTQGHRPVQRTEPYRRGFLKFAEGERSSKPEGLILKDQRADHAKKLKP